MNNVIDEARGQVIAALLYPTESSDTIMQTISKYMLANGVPARHVKNACNVMGSAISTFNRLQAVLTKCDCVCAVTGSLLTIHVETDIFGYPSLYCRKKWTKPDFNESYDMVKEFHSKFNKSPKAMQELLSEPDIVKWHHTLCGKEHILKIIAKFGKDFGLFHMRLKHDIPQYHGGVVINKRWRREHLLASYAAWTGCGIKMGLLRDIRRLILQTLVAME